MADGVLVGGLIKEKEADIVRGAILKTGSRIDGRDTKTVRQIVSEAGFSAAGSWFGALHAW